VKPQSLLGAAKKSMGDHREIHGSWVFGVEALQHVSSFYGISTKSFMASQSAQVSWAKMSPFVSGVYTMLIL